MIWFALFYTLPLVILVDDDARTLDLELDPEELARRRDKHEPATVPAGCSWLSVYARSVQPVSRGATLGG
jgi:dihydroxy-acid dehydratase